MNRKGFTLAETIGVIIVLGLIAVITVPFIDGYIKSSREKALSSNIVKIKEAAKNWNIKYGSEYGCDSTTGCFLTLDELKKSEFLSDEKFTNPITKTELDGVMHIYQDSDNYNYDFGIRKYYLKDQYSNIHDEIDNEDLLDELPANQKVYTKLYIPIDDDSIMFNDIIYAHICGYDLGEEICLNPDNFNEEYFQKLREHFPQRDGSSEVYCIYVDEYDYFSCANPNIAINIYENNVNITDRNTSFGCAIDYTYNSHYIGCSR